MDDLKYQLHQVKRNSAKEFDVDSDTTPKWLSTMPDIYGVTQPFSRLMEQLPAVRATKNPQVIETFFQQLVTEITKLYTYQAEIIDMSDTIPEAEKTAAIQQCLAEGRDYIAKLGAILTYGNE